MKSISSLLGVGVLALTISSPPLCASAPDSHYQLLRDTRSLHKDASILQANLEEKQQQIADREAEDIQMIVNAWRSEAQSERALGLAWGGGGWTGYATALNRGLMVAEIRGMESDKLRAYYGVLMGRYDRLEMFDASTLTPSVMSGEYDTRELKAAKEKSTIARELQKQSGALAFLEAVIQKSPGQTFATIKRIDASLGRLSHADQAQHGLEIEDLEARQAQIQ